MEQLGAFQWRWLLLVLCLWGMVMLSAVSVINSTHHSRIKLNQLESAKRLANGYQVAWGQYLLEQSALTNYGRVESLAKKKLNMKTPQINELVIVQ